MAFYTDNISQVVGSFLALLDAYLVNNSHWTCYDSAAGTNAKVYRCQDSKWNCDFYVKVDDNYTTYCILELWEGWNSGTHAGTGKSRTVFSSTYTLRIYKAIDKCFLCVHDHHFLYFSRNYYVGTFVGRPLLVDESKNVVLFVGASTSATRYNSLVYWPNTSSGGYAFLFDDIGDQVLGGSGDGASGLATQYFRDGMGNWYLSPISVISGTRLIGWLPGVAGLGSSAKAVSGEGIFMDGIEWICLGAGNYFAFVKKA